MANVTLNWELFFANEFIHSLVRERIEALDKARGITEHVSSGTNVARKSATVKYDLSVAKCLVPSRMQREDVAFRNRAELVPRVFARAERRPPAQQGKAVL